MACHAQTPDASEIPSTTTHVRNAKDEEDHHHDAVETPQALPTGSAQYSLRLSLLLSGMYIGTGIILLLTIRYSKLLEKSGVLSYDSTAIVMAIEVAKILVSVVLKYVENGEFLPYMVTCGSRRAELWRMSWVYVIPAFLYALYNNLTYVNLSHFDPGTVLLFMQVRILFTGLLFVLVLKRSLSFRQWGALGVLTVGLIIKYISLTVMQSLDAHMFLVILQPLCSSLAGVYNEWAFKREEHLSIHLQNVFLYSYGILFNVILGLIFAPEKYRRGSLFRNPHVIFIPIILVGALNGLTAALILKFINVLVKALASAVEVILMSLLGAVLLGESLTRQDIVAGVIVMCTVYIYYTKGYGSNSSLKLN